MNEWLLGIAVVLTVLYTWWERSHQHKKGYQLALEHVDDELRRNLNSKEQGTIQARLILRKLMEEAGVKFHW